MDQPPEHEEFLSRVPVFTSFARIADPAAYVPVPDDWLIGCADIVGSTRAIGEGRYKTVNTAGAAVIAAVSNAVDHAAFPYVFGGDGASFAVPPAWAERAQGALAATATFVHEEFGLELRVGAVPVADVRAAGVDLRLAQFARSPHVTYAMFSGGGLAFAEAELKRGRYAVPPAPPGTRPDLSGLSCRFDEIAARRGVILSLIVRPAPAGDPERYRRAIEEVLSLAESERESGRPVPAGGPAFHWPPSGIDLESRMTRGRGPAWLARLRLLASGVVSYLILRRARPVGGFDPNRYLSDLVANSDYRKYDDGLRMTIDCAPDLADRIEAKLGQFKGDLHYGVHRQGAALMTCITHSPMRRDHVHFIDGAAGGYAAAASDLKAMPS